MRFDSCCDVAAANDDRAAASPTWHCPGSGSGSWTGTSGAGLLLACFGAADCGLRCFRAGVGHASGGTMSSIESLGRRLGGEWMSAKHPELQVHQLSYHSSGLML